MTIAAGYWPAAIEFMYSGRPKTRRSRRPVAAVFAPAAIGPPQLLVFLVVETVNPKVKQNFSKIFSKNSSLYIYIPCYDG